MEYISLPTTPNKDTSNWQCDGVKMDAACNAMSSVFSYVKGERCGG